MATKNQILNNPDFREWHESKSAYNLDTASNTYLQARYKKYKASIKITYKKGDKEVSEKTIDKFIKKAENWSAGKVRKLQAQLGLEPTGRYDTETAAEHKEYFEKQGQWGLKKAHNWLENNLAKYEKLKRKKAEAEKPTYNWVATDTGVVKMTTEQADLYNAQEEYKNKVKQRRDERNAIEKSMLDDWKTLTGVTPTQANINWATEKTLQGWGYDDFYFWMKDRPEMKKMYPGMPSGMMPSEYIQHRDKLNLAYMENVGRPLKRHEIASIMKGGTFPDDTMYLGQPAIQESELK